MAVAYPVCPSCSRVLTEDMDLYDMALEEILNNHKLSTVEKQIAGAKLLDDYGIFMRCCRMRILCRLPYHKIIQT